MNNGKDSLHYKENNLISKNNKHNKVKVIGRESTKWHSKIASGNSGSSSKRGRKSSKSSGSGIIDTKGGQTDMSKVSAVLNEIVDNDLSKLDALAKINSYKNKGKINQQEYNALLKQIEGAYN